MRVDDRAYRLALARRTADPAALASRLMISFQAAARLIAAAAPANDPAAIAPTPITPVPVTPARARRGGGRCQAIAKLRDEAARAGACTCQWIEGEPSGRAFCGDPTKPGSSYCEAHHARCYRKPTAAEKRLMKAGA